MKRFDNLVETQINSVAGYDGRIFYVTDDTIRKADGSTSHRDVVHHNGAVCILPVTKNNDVYVVEQFRYPMNEIVTELPAGKIDGNESPMEAAIRELKEEIGCTTDKMEYLGKIYASPAYTTEVIHLFLARDVVDGNQHLDKGEQLNVEKMHYNELLTLVDSGKIYDAKTVALTYRALNLI